VPKPPYAASHLADDIFLENHLNLLFLTSLVRKIEQ